MKKYIYEKININCFFGAVSEEHRKIIDEYAAKGYRYVGFNNCYILLQKSRQTLENTKIFVGVLSITSCIVLYHSTLGYDL